MTDGGKKPDLHVVGGPEVSGDSASETSWATREEWLAHGRRLGERVERDRWALGDWACHGDRAYGELAAAAEKIDVTYQTLRHLASVARKIELCRRRHSLSWSHHAEVASLPPDVGDGLLDRAEAEGWSRDRMREEAQAVCEVGRLKAQVQRLSDENERLRNSKSRAAMARRSMDRRREHVRVLFREIAVRYRQVAETLEDPAALSDARAMHGNCTDLCEGLGKVVDKGIGRCDDVLNKRIKKAIAALGKAEPPAQAGPADGADKP